jgi:predicted ATPase
MGAIMDKNLSDLLVFLVQNIHKIDPQQLDKLKLFLENIKEDIYFMEYITEDTSCRVPPSLHKE